VATGLREASPVSPREYFETPKIHAKSHLLACDDGTAEADPWLPGRPWDCCYLAGVPYHGRMVRILYDKRGNRYGKRRGLRIRTDGNEVGMCVTVRRLTTQLPSR